MNGRRFFWFFVLKMAAVIFLAAGGSLLWVNRYYLTALLCLFLIVNISVSIYSERRRTIGRLSVMVRSLNECDYASHPITSDHPCEDTEQQLMQEINIAWATLRHQAREAVRQETETEAWEKLIRVLTHEMMNSLAPIISLSETMSESGKTPASAEEYETMRRAMEVVHRRSSGLLTFIHNYRKLTCMPEPTMTDCKLHPLLEHLHHLFSGNEFSFEYRVYPLDLIARCDAEMLEQILINLIKNAHDALQNRSEGKIIIKARAIDSAVSIVVWDNGVGISPEAQDKIFIPFYSTKSTGSGIGLSLCRQMMYKMGGTIEVSSRAENTSFTLTLPSKAPYQIKKMAGEVTS